jgi:hypothetical protein
MLLLCSTTTRYISERTRDTRMYNTTDYIIISHMWAADHTTTDNLRYQPHALTLGFRLTNSIPTLSSTTKQVCGYKIEFIVLFIN